MSRRRKALLVGVVWLLVFEAGGWVIDAFTGARYELLDGITTAHTQTEPVPESPPDWPPRALRVRVPDRGEARSEPYTLGGRVIEDAWPDAKQEWLLPEELEGSRPGVYVLGGSAPLGYPYAYEDSFARGLERALPRHRVINVGQAGWTSGQVLGAVDRVLAHFEPHTLVIYSGNNEWIRWGPDPSSRGLDLDWQTRLAHSRAFAVALWLGHRMRAGSPPPEDASPLHGWRHAFEHPALDLDIGAWREERADHLRLYRHHLSEIRDRARARSVRVIFCSVPFSYRLSPSIEHRQPDVFDAEHAEEVRSLTRRAALVLGADDERALTLLDEALALDDEPPLLHYMRGEALRATERHGDAEGAYARSREQMVGNLGARLSVNRIVREVAVGEGVRFVDLRARFDEHQRALGGHYNEDLIHDDCHPSPLGQRLMVRLLAPIIEDQSW